MPHVYKPGEGRELRYQLTVRIPRKLFTKLEKRAIRGQTSINVQLNDILEEYFRGKRT